jgi:hypothetical protein
MEKKYIFIIDTDQYAGNFEREMCAFCTGQIGECEVGKEEGDAWMKEFGQEKGYEICEQIASPPDEHGCCRPVEIQNSPKGYPESMGSVGIFFYEYPEEELINMIKERSVKFALQKQKRYPYKQRTMKILGFRLRIETTTEEEVEI